MNAQACREAYINVSEEKALVDLNANICTFLREYNVDSGDIGGPLFCDRKDRAVLVGVASWGRKNYPFVYSKVTHFETWIKENAINM